MPGSTDGSKYFTRGNRRVKFSLGEFGCRQGVRGNGKVTSYNYNIERWIRDTILKVRMMPVLLMACGSDIASNKAIGCPAR
jgi:hypothetical protein